MGGVAGQQDAAPAVGVGDAVVDPEARAPDQLLHPRGLGLGSAGVEQVLDEGDAGLPGRLVHGGDDAVQAAGQRGGHDQTGGREVQDDLVVGHPAGQPDVGQHERLGVRAAAEADPRALADGAVHAVGADQIGGVDDLPVVQGGGDAVGVLLDAAHPGGPDHLAAELVQTGQQVGLGVGLGDHQGVGVGGRQAVEGHRQQHPVAVADGEDRRVDAVRGQPVRHAVRLQDFQRAGVHDGGAGGVGAALLRVHDHDVPAVLGQDDRGGQPDGSGSDDEHLGVHGVSLVNGCWHDRKPAARRKSTHVGLQSLT